jgi:hypothetical protein
MPFSRIKKDRLDQALELAQSNGIEHTIFPDSENLDWSTLQFTTNHSRKRFESLCLDNDILVDGYQVTQLMIDAVVDGKHPSDVLDEALTNGMKNVFSKMKVKSVCPQCELHVPKYPGRYPKNCPSCGKQLI